MVKRSKNIDDNETIIPKIINGFDFSLSSFLESFFDKDVFLSLLIIFENGFFTLKNKFNRLLIH